MTVQEAMQKRRSVRKFTEEPVNEEMTQLLLHAAMSGPSACNKVPWDFYVITKPETLAELRGATRFSGMTAPMAMVVCGNLSRALPAQMAPYWVQDCSAATENILLQAVELGLGTVWCGVHPQKKAEENVTRILNLPEDQIPLNIIYIGHPATESEPRDQYEEAYVHYVR